MTSFKWSLLQGASMVAVLGLSSPAAAQTASGPAAASSTIDEVVVTAQRREESLQDVPLAVSAFSPEALKAQRIDGGASLQNAVPNVSFSRTVGGGYNFAIRGISGGVGVHVNNAPLGANNRLADAEFYDVERVEVLRGPQGTLYGRNATSGVINVITTKAQADFSASLTGEFANYDSRRFNGHVNLPFGDKLSVRLAGILLERSGFSTNELTGDDLDSRDLNAFRISGRFEPTERFRADLIFERFNEDDSRARYQKQLCITDNGPDAVGNAATGVVPTNAYSRTYFGQGCMPGRITDPRALGQVNSTKTTLGILADRVGLTSGSVFEGATQNSDLRTYPSYFPSEYEASNDLYQLAMGYDLTDSLRLTSLTTYSTDGYLATQDYNNQLVTRPFNTTIISPNGIVNDPQIGAFNTFRALGGYEGSTETTSQEFRLQSTFVGPLNFDVGVSYNKVESGVVYSIVSNGLSGYSQFQNAAGAASPAYVPIYIDPKPGFPTDGSGHNYYYNKVGDNLESKAASGEVYYQFNDQVKLTLGGRYTVDEVVREQYSIPLLTPGAAPPIPAARAGVTNKKFTYRVSADWSPEISFTDDTLFYGSVSSGYRNGGVNGSGPNPTFKPETITAFEVGTRNTLLDGRATVNATAFYYDYSDYQISKALNRVLFTENIDAEVKGVELEAIFRPTPALRLNAQIGYLDTKISSGSSVDVFDPTNGDPNFEHVNTASGGGCVVPTALAVAAQRAINTAVAALGPNPTYRQLATASASIAGLCSSTQATGGTAVSLSGRQLPQAPEWTVSLGAQYTWDLGESWAATLRGDYRWQARAYSRVYNTESDIIDAYDNANVTLNFSDSARDLDVQLFVKNVMDEDNITGISLSDETAGFTRNLFLVDPRTYGISVTKRFN